MLTRRKVAKKPSTLATDRGRIERHIKPLLGRMAVAAVDRADIERSCTRVAEGETAAQIKTAETRAGARTGGKGTATRTVGLLGAIFTYAVRHACGPTTRFMASCALPMAGASGGYRTTNMRRSGDALREGEAGKIWPAAVALARFLALTGWRSGEALALRWSDIDLARRTAPSSPTPKRAAASGRCRMPLATCCAVCRGFAPTWCSRRPAVTAPWWAFQEVLAADRQAGRLPADITPHVLRHSFASLAADLGYSEPTIAALVGHKGHTITSRYVHSADAVLLAAADAVANRTAELMGERKPQAEVVSLRMAQ